MTENATSKSSAPASDSAPGKRKVAVSRLIAEAHDFLGLKSSDVAAGLHGLDGDREVTIDEAHKRVESWLSKPLAPEEES